MPELNMPFGMGQGSGNSFRPDMGSIGNGFGSLIGGLFPGKNPYQAGMAPYQQGINQAAQYQNPFYSAGVGALGNYQDILSHMSNPSEFINNLTNQYQESPAAKYLQQQGIKSAQNSASADGTLGSTPMQQFLSQQSQGIASQDMENWLSHVLGINSQSLGGYQNLINGGQSSANSLSSMYGNLGASQGQAAYGGQDWNNRNRNSTLGGIGGILGGILGGFV